MLEALDDCIQESSDRGKEFEYVVKRLIRGLASSRECARLGFATVLTHVRGISTVIWYLKLVVQLVSFNSLYLCNAILVTAAHFPYVCLSASCRYYIEIAA